MEDRRYEYVLCAKCSVQWQRIDWGCVAHVYFCEGGKVRPPFDPPLNAEWPMSDEEFYEKFKDNSDEAE